MCIILVTLLCLTKPCLDVAVIIFFFYFENNLVTIVELIFEIFCRAYNKEEVTLVRYRNFSETAYEQKLPGLIFWMVFNWNWWYLANRGLIFSNGILLQLQDQSQKDCLKTNSAGFVFLFDVLSGKEKVQRNSLFRMFISFSISKT